MFRQFFDFVPNRPVPRHHASSVRGKARPDRCRPRLEPLEDRWVPTWTSVGITSTGVLQAIGDNSGNTGTVAEGSGMTTFTDPISSTTWTFPDVSFNSIQIQSGNGNDTITILSSVWPVDVSTQDGDDTISVGNGNLDDVNVHFSVDGGAGDDTLTVNDQNYGPGCPTYTHTIFTATRGSISVSHAPGFVLDYTDIEHGHLNEAACGTVKIIPVSTDSTTVGDWTYTSGSGPTDVHVGGNPGRLNIPFAMYFDNQGADTTLSLNDGGTTTAPAYSITGNAILRSGTPPITWNQLQSVDLTLASLGIANVLGTEAGTPLTLIGSGPATVNVGNAADGVQDILGDLRIENPPSFNTVNINDTADPGPPIMTHDTWTPDFDPVPWGRITGLAPALITYEYDDTTSVTVQTGFNGATVDVLATGVPLILVGNALSTVNVGNPAGGVQDILGDLLIENPPSYNTINIDDSADGCPRTVTHDTWTPPFDPVPWGQIMGLAPAMITYEYDDTSALTLQTGLGPATINVLATGVPLTVMGNGPSVVSVGNDAHGVQDILGALTIQNPTSSTTLEINNCGDPRNRFVNESVANGVGTIAGLAPASINFQTSELDGLNIMTGSGVTTFSGWAAFTVLGFPVTYDTCGGTNIFV